ncbi:DEAD/DEAH box helicase [Bacillus canaveralius]|uniref:DEAD/DEAH box helicase n=1 Tax=Bacillus canaveralius TaxID=1403243 RepID=UPI0015E0C740|nr:DEAD/DEAH box helicase family protein [Bacillus canaveralius]
MHILKVKLPSVIHSFKLHKNIIYQTVKEYQEESYSCLNEKEILEITNLKTKEKVLIVDSNKQKNIYNNFSFIIQVKDIKGNLKQHIEEGCWVKHQDLLKEGPSKHNAENVRKTWANNLFPHGSGKEKRGLREPQVGALYSALSHWTVSDDPATIVMPTGTGKTETMLSVMIGAKTSKILTIVPSDALREQISSKFISLGILPRFGIVGKVKYPIVGVLEKRIKDINELIEFFSICNVVVTTMSLLSGISGEQKEKIATMCSHMFIDEAHHIAAKTWSEFKSYFKEKRILQFTATPFRNDGKYIDGKIIYNYPLNKAQEEGYFKPINFIPIEEYNESMVDQTIAEEAVQQLKKDLDAGYDHILMARVNSAKRADEIHEIYKRYSGYKPVKIYSSMNVKEKTDALQQIKTKKSRIIICVNMLGEGFDLPQLKISALHDRHQSLGITLQFIGRFTRTADGLGNASLIANIANHTINDQIQELYQQDADWNQLIQQKSKESIDRRLDLDNLANDFQGDQVESFSIQELRPKTSTVVYKTKLPKWAPETLEKRVSTLDNTWILKNTHENVIIVVQKRNTPLTWSNTRKLYNTLWESSIFYWNEEKNILFVNSSANEWLDSWVKDLIHEPIRINSDVVFHSFHDIQRLQLNTVGLNEAVKGPLRYRMYTGVDISEALSTAEKRTSVKSNIFGIGYELGIPVSVGASYKGKVWSKSTSDLPTWIEWCNKTGEKLTNEDIKMDDILKGVLRPTVVNDIPAMSPISVDWPVYLFENNYFNAELKIGPSKRNLFETDILFISKEKKTLSFEIMSGDISSKFSMKIEDNRPVYAHEHGPKIEIIPSTKAQPINIVSFFTENNVIFQYPDTSYLEGSIFVKVPDNEFVFDKDKIEAWDWTGIDIKKESQYAPKINTVRKDSIQYKVIQTLKMNNKYKIVFDDDGSGEAADIIAVADNKRVLQFEFYHCKYSNKERAGQRINDLYEVCGQANKSVDWRKNLLKIINHIRHREKLRNKADKRSRFEIGDHKELAILESKMKVYDLQLKVFIVQPGISKDKMTQSQLNILAATEHYLQSTFKIGLTVIGNK